MLLAVWEGNKRDFNNLSSRCVLLLNFPSSVLSCDDNIDNLNGESVKFMVRKS